MDTDYDKYYNKGHNCDICANLYLCGRDGDAVGCKRYDAGLDCEFDKLTESNTFFIGKGDIFNDRSSS